MSHGGSKSSLLAHMVVGDAEEREPIVSTEEEQGTNGHDAVGPVGEKRRKLGAFAVAVISFAAVAGGPYGIEAAVGAAGAMPVLIGSLVLAVTWSATQALVAAELSTTFPSNGGYITWAVRGLGPVLGYVNAANCIASAVCNLPLYPVLFASYVSSLFPDVTDEVLFAIKFVCLLLTVAFNAAGFQAVELASSIFSVLVQTPFIMIPIVAAAQGRPLAWSAAASVAPDWQGSFGLFISTLCWNSQGWVNIGNIASEVRNPKTSYPLGSAIAVVAVALNYMIPVLFCIAVAPDLTVWDTGYFVTIAEDLAPWLGWWTTIAAMFSSANNFLPQLGTTSRALRFAALYGMVPIPILRRNWVRTNVPLAAILTQAVVVGILMNFTFDVLIIINVLFYNVGLALQFAAFLRLKYTAPNIERPYAVPGGLTGAWAVTLLFFAVLGVSLYATSTNTIWAIYIVGLANILFFFGGMVWARWGHYDGLLEMVDEAEAAGVDATPAVDATKRTGAVVQRMDDEEEE